MKVYHGRHPIPWSFQTESVYLLLSHITYFNWSASSYQTL
jgi:hypothetical protein